MEGRVRVILVTDGDNIARRATEVTAHELGLRCISASAGNPTPLTGPELIALIKQVPYDPVLVMADDKGDPGRGAGERALAYLCTSPEIEVLGAVAVASHTKLARGTPVNLSITRQGREFDGVVNKDGDPLQHREFLTGDTVDVLRTLSLPVIVGMGDPGKMQGADDVNRGCRVTIRAVEKILAYHGIQPRR
jgi:stage V sporulation protein AE